MLTVAAALAVFCYALTAPLLGVLLPGYAISPQQQGSLALANALGLTVASLIAGPVIDKQGKKPVLMAGLILLLAALLMTTGAGGYESLLVVYFVLGLGGGTVSNSTNSLVGDESPERRGPALNFLNMFFGLGGIVTTFAASYVVKPRVLCAAVAVVVAVALVAAAFVRTSVTSNTGFHAREVRALLSESALILFCALMFLYVACEVGIWNWLKAYLISAGFSTSNAGGVVSYGFAFGMLVGRLAASRILLKVPAITLLTISAMLMVVSQAAALQLTSRIAITTAVFFAGFTMAPVFPTTLALVGDLFPRRSATAMGVTIASGWLGLAVSSPIIGALATGSSLRHALLLLPAMAGAMVLVSLVLRSALVKAVTV